MLRTLLLSLAISLPLAAEADFPSSFSSAKRLAEAQVYFDQNQSFYCECPFTFDGGPVLEACGYQVRKQPARAARIEWEHVMPAYDLGRQLQCWQEGGRDHCRSTNPTFRQAEADLHNLVPAVGEVNGDRSNMRFGMVASRDAFQYGQCQAKVDFPERTFEPPERARGDIARIYWYMRDTYGIQISRQQQQLFQAWAATDPIDDWERIRNQRIAAIQGNENPYVTGPTAIEPTSTSFPLPSDAAANDSEFSCSPSKTCRAMSSCDQATFHLMHCGNTRLDGDGDGVPCEAICR